MKALIILAHGSKINQCLKSIEFHKRRIEKLEVFDEVKIAFLEFKPKLHEVVKKCKSETIYIIPFFLLYGVHTIENIPKLVEMVKSKYKEKKIVLCKPIGTDPLITFAILNRVIEEIKDEEGYKD
ncbi:hypothetical protein DRO30_04070 [Candidatus Bathyarchaeota archaeon]|nr:MAG: hypothetical protein DRO30_04070 [Candidatus Bathyarchaeota archaeon]